MSGAVVKGRSFALPAMEFDDRETGERFVPRAADYVHWISRPSPGQGDIGVDALFNTSFGELDQAEAARPTPTFASPTADPSNAGAQQVFIEPENNVLFCNSGDLVEDPAANLQRIEMNFNPDGTVVFVYPGASPLTTFSQDYSYSIQARLGHSGGGGYDVGMYEVHAGQTKTGMLASAAGDIMPGTEGTVSLTDQAVVFVFDGYKWSEGDTITARSFHLPTESDQVRCGQTQAWPLVDPGPQ